MHCLDNVTAHVPHSNTVVCQTDTEKVYVECNILVDILDREKDINYFVISNSEDKTELS